MSERKRPWAWQKFIKGCHGQKLRGMEKKKKRKRKIRKIMTINKDNKWVFLSLLKLKDDKLFL